MAQESLHSGKSYLKMSVLVDMKSEKVCTVR